MSEGTKRKVGEVWKDLFISRIPWRLQLSKHRQGFKTKKEAVKFWEESIRIGCPWAKENARG